MAVVVPYDVLLYCAVATYTKSVSREMLGSAYSWWTSVVDHAAAFPSSSL